MRYQNWDVLVFPDECKIPMQEFKTSCQVIPDSEFTVVHNQSNQILVPTVTSFIPGLPTGSPFRISIHCWENPQISRYTQTLSKHPELAAFEARLFIDGRIAGSKLFSQLGQWPITIETSVELNKHGEFEKLKFPMFHRELLAQSYWNAGDDLGRIKLVIAEGFPRDSMSMQFERVKNIVSFSFQHAPLEILETSSIAWPNAAMWRQMSFSVPYLFHQIFPQHEQGGEAHSHSPRKTVSNRPELPALSIGSMPPPNATVFPRQPICDPFTEPTNAPFNGWRHPSSADVSMPDYSSSNTRASSTRHVTDPMLASESQDRRFDSLQNIGAFESVCDALIPRATSNLPHSAAQEGTVATIAEGQKLSNKVDVVQSSVISGPSDEMGCLVPEASPNSIWSRKENVYGSPSATDTFGNEGALRKVAQTFTATNSSGTKRQRNVTPAASKVIDDEDEPRASPLLGKMSRGASKHEGREGERRVLSGIENL